MQLGLAPLFEQLQRAPDAAYVLATVVGTEGSSYRKSGAMMLMTPDAPPIGLVSGGCLEGDLLGHAQAVFDDGETRFVHYDLSQDDAALWGLGLGCGGAIDIMLERADKNVGHAGLARVYEHWCRGERCWLLKSLATGPLQPAQVLARSTILPSAAHALVDATGDGTRAARDAQQILIPVLPPLRLAVCGAGADALPVAAVAQLSGFQVTVFDHRPALATSARFAAGVNVVCQPLEVLVDEPALAAADAVVVMAHHLENDARFLRAAVNSDAQYIGLLGPTARRDDVMTRAGVATDARVFGPAGLALGADLPESIALSIVAQAHAVLRGATGGSLA